MALPDGGHHDVVRVYALGYNMSHCTQDGRRNTLNDVDVLVPANTRRRLRVAFSSVRIRVLFDDFTYGAAQ